MKIIKMLGAGLAVLALASCGGDAAAPTTTVTQTAPAVVGETTPAAVEPVTDEPADASAWAEKIKQETTTKIETITEDNDPNDLIGRPNGYESAAVLFDSSVECDELGSDCGAVIEVFPAAEEAQARSDYIQGVLKDNPMFGTEWHSVRGTALLRVSGEIKPSVANGYTAAFEG